MHHKPAGGATRCAIQPVNGPGSAVLTTLTGTLGPIAESTSSIQPPVSTEYLRAGDLYIAGERPVPPDPPPPRV
jgi:hypothetical protein